MTSETQNYTNLEQAFSLGNGQDSALNWLRKSHTTVAIFLVSGIKLEGVISGFDQYSVLLTDAHNNQQMIYKAKISTIAPLGNRMSSNTFQRN
jgi:host factor-I protein